MFPVFGFGKHSALMSVAVLVAVFGIGALIGASAAGGGQSLDEVQTQLSDNFDRVATDVESNTSGIYAPFAKSVIVPSLEGAFYVTSHGVSFGYAHPQAAVWLGRLSPWPLMGVYTHRIYTLYRRQEVGR